MWLQACYLARSMSWYEVPLETQGLSEHPTKLFPKTEVRVGMTQLLAGIMILLMFL